ncbi:fluoride efflux transporter FluC [Prochlorococcus marinus]|uniref:fluoride efflux transporter FluC n=1 Tax=Prochlorococcus TaxID=1218 RepID=UPI0007B3D664|nr:CrcB family protein [Prochlorococcus marinus]KZR78311.1 putative fluoride ion transporter CrcB [Prochlorococcus marinus str. MIT 1323]
MAKTTQPLRNQLNEISLVALGAVPGALLRWQVQNDLLVNVIGAAILGFVVGLPFRSSRQLLLGVGFCGSLTTFSSWMVECSILISQGAWLSALGLIGLTLGLGLGVAALGFLIGRQFRP